MPPEFTYADVSIVIEDYLQRAGEASGCEVTFKATPADADWTAVPDGIALEMYRIVQEAVANAMQHSGATAVDVSLDMSSGALSLTVTDNGDAPLRNGTGIGRRTMRQRAEAAGGKAHHGKKGRENHCSLHNSQRCQCIIGCAVKLDAKHRDYEFRFVNHEL